VYAHIICATTGPKEAAYLRNTRQTLDFLNYFKISNSRRCFDHIYGIYSAACKISFKSALNGLNKRFKHASKTLVYTQLYATLWNRSYNHDVTVRTTLPTSANERKHGRLAALRQLPGRWTEDGCIGV